MASRHLAIDGFLLREARAFRHGGGRPGEEEG